LPLCCSESWLAHSASPRALMSINSEPSMAWLWCKHESELDGSDLGANLHLCSKHGIPDCRRSLASAP
jgi:hypothetical protein